MSPAIRRTFTVLLALAASAGAPAAASAPAGVSPGELERVSPLEHRCPTFSWTEAEGAVGYQLVAYTLPSDPVAEVVLSPETQVLGRRLPPRATSWTPPADLCFAPGGSYVWFIRAVLDERDDEILDVSEWSEGLSFGVPPVAVTGDDPYAHRDPGDPRRERPGVANRVDVAGAGAVSAAKGGRSVVTAAAAIRGDSVDSTGEVHGVIGATASASGAGLAAANTAGGPDLILDGATQGLSDTRISESGLDRSSATDQVFTISNSGAGAVTLAVDGAITGSGAGLTGLDAGNLASGTLPSARLAGSYASAVSLSNTHNSFAGNGAGLTNLNASSLAAGTLPGARLAGAYANAVTLSNPGNLFTGDGSGLTNLDADTLGGVAPGDLWPGQSWGLYDATVADDAGNPGNGASIAIGADGLGIISHLSGSWVLKVTHCNDLRCSAPTTVEHSQSAGDVTGIAIGGDGLAMISFQDPDASDLRVAHCSDLGCSAATFTTVDSTGDVGRGSSIVTGQDGNGLISYVDSTNHSLKVAHCTNATCTTRSTSTVDGGTYDIGFKTCLTIGADGLPLIAYADTTNHSLRVAHCSNADCGTATLSTADPAGSGTSCSITIGADGLGLISYLAGSRVKVAHCSNLLCSATTTSVIDDFSTGFAAAGTSITIGSDGRGVVSYYDPDSDNLKVAHCSDDACSTATAVDAKISGDVGWGSAITIGLDGMPLVAYRYSGGNQLLVTHCSNRFCVPKARMR